jgi:hypothetical protein
MCERACPIETCHRNPCRWLFPLARVAWGLTASGPCRHANSNCTSSTPPLLPKCNHDHELHWQQQRTLFSFAARLWTLMVEKRLLRHTASFFRENLTADRPRPASSNSGSSHMSISLHCSTNRIAPNFPPPPLQNFSKFGSVDSRIITASTAREISPN